MRLLIDTHLLLWVGYAPERLSTKAHGLIEDTDNELLFSAISIAEVAIKFARGLPDFRVEPNILRQQLIINGYNELALTSAHAAALASLPPIHRDPFDRLLLAQARVESVVLLTSDRMVARYLGLVLAI